LQNKSDKFISERQDLWIRKYIDLFAHDNTKMKYIFSCISSLESNLKKEYILLFLKHNESVEDFYGINLNSDFFG